MESIESVSASFISGAARALIGKVAHSSDPIFQNLSNFYSQFIALFKILEVL